jgi:hypothetical protein
MTVKPLRLLTAAGIWALLALAQAPAAGADPPPPPQPPFLPNTGFIDGSYGYLYGIYVVPPPSTVDARGVHVTATVDPSQQALGMPGSELGNSPPIVGFFTGANMQRSVSAGQSAPLPPSLGVDAVALSAAVPPEDPSGIPPENRPGPESTQPGPAAVIVPPILETPGGRPFGAAGGGAGHG